MCSSNTILLLDTVHDPAGQVQTLVPYIPYLPVSFMYYSDRKGEKEQYWPMLVQNLDLDINSS